MSPGKFADSILQRLETAASQGLSRVAALKGLKPAAPALQALAKLLEQGGAVEAGKRLYAKPHIPTPERAALAIREVLLTHPTDCLTTAQVKKRAPRWAVPKVDKILREMVASREIIRLRVGRSHVFAHREAVADWFPSSAKEAPVIDTSALLKKVLNAYRTLIETRGGFRTVPIAELRVSAKVELSELHALIRTQIQARRANIYRSSSALTPQSVLDAAMRLNNDPEPYVSVEFYD